MLGILRRPANWFLDRTGFADAFKAFLSKKIPASVGWPHVFGSLALFVLLVQTATGLLLALNFAPTPEGAYTSLHFIVHEILGGRLIHGLHHWGATMMIIVVVIHMLQVFLWGAYKRPHDLTWFVGVLLLFVILSFGLTGYLLPWDNKAYWGTVVTTRIMASVPGLGALIARLAGADHGVGVVTFARFYTIHTLLLPVAALGLVAFHVYLIQKHGVTGRGPNDPNSQSFYPRQLWRDTVAIFVGFILLFVAAGFLDVPLERRADPSDTLYTPRPEWYFLFLFQLLKLFPGELEWLATIGLPTAAVLGLLLLPLYSGRARLDRKLPAIGAVFLGLGIWGGLTLAAVQDLPKRKETVARPLIEWSSVAPQEIAGSNYFQSLRCGTCHNVDAGSPKAGPNLPKDPPAHPKQWLVQHVKSLKGIEKDLNIVELNALLTFTANGSAETVTTIKEMSSEFVHGAQMYVTSACATCHKVNGEGGTIGPALNGLAYRRSKEWVKAHFLEPQKYSPGSIMPIYLLKAEDRDALVLYLFSLEQ